MQIVSYNGCKMAVVDVVITTIIPLL